MGLGEIDEPTKRIVEYILGFFFSIEMPWFSTTSAKNPYAADRGRVHRC